MSDIQPIASDSGTRRPIMLLLEALGKRWALRVLWELKAGRLTFRQLQENCGRISPTVLNRRLQELKELNFIDHDGQGFGLTEQGTELGTHLLTLNKFAAKWASTTPK